MSRDTLKREAREVELCVDLNAFQVELEILEREALEGVSEEMMQRELWWHRTASLTLTLTGWALTLWLASAHAPEVSGVRWLTGGLAALCIGVGVFSRWIAAHHICHKAYDKVEALPLSLKSKRFGLGWARFWQWLDWMPTEAWSQEHNLCHHYRLNEEELDPDIVEDKAWWLRTLPLWWPLKLLIVALGACVWKPLYYGPNTLLELERARLQRAGAKKEARALNLDSWASWSPLGPHLWRALWRSWLPGLLRLSLLPLTTLVLVKGSSALGLTAWGEGALEVSLWVTLVAELYTNLHAFVVIVPNHAGEDMARFEGKPASRGAFYVRQIAGSCDYGTGAPLSDFLMGYLNYQIEHHVWPQMSVSGYRWVQPRLKALCALYGVPYVQQSVWRRAWAMSLVAVGQRSMYWAEGEAHVEGLPHKA